MYNIGFLLTALPIYLSSRLRSNDEEHHCYRIKRYYQVYTWEQFANLGLPSRHGCRRRIDMFRMDVMIQISIRNFKELNLNILKELKGFSASLLEVFYSKPLFPLCLGYND